MPSILITGGTGTLGHALVRACLNREFQHTHGDADQPFDRVIVYSRDEVKQAQMTAQFGKHPAFRAFLGDVRDYARLEQACRGVDVVVAAAALKRVDATAYNPMELLRTNVIGVENTIRAAVAAGVTHVVVVSSDKCVAPTTPYGVSKAMAETIAVTSNAWSWPLGTKVSAVRYGNVLGSRGSVVEMWRQQAAANLPLAITDERMSRFVMTIEQAVACVRFAVRTMIGGEIVVPVLPSAMVKDIANAVSIGHAFEIIGLRPGGEKLAESLLCDHEPPRTRRIDVSPTEAYYIVAPAQSDWWGGTWPGEPVAADLRYASDSNDRWLRPIDLRELMATSEACRC